MSKLYSLLDKIGKETVSIITRDISSKKLIKTGALRDSISYSVDKTKDGYELNFEQIYYGEFLDKGTRYISPREFFEKHISDQMNKYVDDISEAIFQ